MRLFSSGLVKSALLLLILFMSSVEVQALTSRFAKNVNGEIVCEEVIESDVIMPKSTDPEDGFYSIHNYMCAVSPEYSVSGVIGITLEIKNVDDSFKRDYEKARSRGHTELVVQNPLLYNSTLELPTDEEMDGGMIQSFEAPYSRKLLGLSKKGGYIRGGRSHIHPGAATNQKLPKRKYSWRLPSLPKFSRRLAINTSGTRSIVVFRVTTTFVNGTTSSPTDNAATVSNNVFGNALTNIATQYEVCSNGQLDFEAATGLGLTYSESGVVEVTLDATNSADAITIANKIVLDYASAIAGIDHVFYHVPSHILDQSNGNANWFAFAYLYGKQSWYRNDSILNALAQIHEVGHNLGLRHSNENGVEYADTTCNMGFSGTVDAAYCFNGAKSVELGWYSSHVTKISPSTGSNFSGKMIGVNDFAASSDLTNSPYKLVVEIENPANADNYFVMYNKAEGINVSVREAQNQVVVVQGAKESASNKVVALSVGDYTSISNFYFNYGLKILVQEGDVDNTNNSIDYVNVDISLQGPTCSVDSDCDDGNGCSTDTCVNGQCVYTPIPFCCGNYVCEEGEFCSTCSQDCQAPTDCNEIDDRVDTMGGGYYYSGAFGILFQVDVNKDVIFYEIEVDLSIAGGAAERQESVKVYTKENTSSNSLNEWDLVYNGIATSTFYMLTIPFTERKATSAGNSRLFYIVLLQGGDLAWAQEVKTVSNTDMEILPATVRGESIDTTTIGNQLLFSGNPQIHYSGGLKYDYVRKAPSEIPTEVPSSQPSTLPSEFPSMSSDKPSLSPSSEPSETPSDSSEAPSMLPSSLPSEFPSMSSDKPWLSPSETPSDSSEAPSMLPSSLPSEFPSMSSDKPSMLPSSLPSELPSYSNFPSNQPSKLPSLIPSFIPSDIPSDVPSDQPSVLPSLMPSDVPSDMPSDVPSVLPSIVPSYNPSVNPSETPSEVPSFSPSEIPSLSHLPTLSYNTLSKMVLKLTGVSELSTELATAIRQGIKKAYAPVNITNIILAIIPSTSRFLSVVNERNLNEEVLEVSAIVSAPLDENTATSADKLGDVAASVAQEAEASGIDIVVSAEVAPSEAPSTVPSLLPSASPSNSPSLLPSLMPSDLPSDIPSDIPSDSPSDQPSSVPSSMPSDIPSDSPSDQPSSVPSSMPSDIPSRIVRQMSLQISLA